MSLFSEQRGVYVFMSVWKRSQSCPCPIQWWVFQTLIQPHSLACIACSHQDLTAKRSSTNTIEQTKNTAVTPESYLHAIIPQCCFKPSVTCASTLLERVLELAALFGDTFHFYTARMITITLCWDGFRVAPSTLNTTKLNLSCCLKEHKCMEYVRNKSSHCFLCISTAPYPLETISLIIMASFCLCHATHIWFITF